MRKLQRTTVALGYERWAIRAGVVTLVGAHWRPVGQYRREQGRQGLGRYETTRTADDYKQAGDRYGSFADWERDDLVANIGGDLKQCPEPVALRMVWHLWHCDEDYGRRVAATAGIDIEKAKSLEPLPGKPASHQSRPGCTY